MDFPEAIRVGSAMTKEDKTVFFSNRFDGECYACAVGAAMYAVTGDVRRASLLGHASAEDYFEDIAKTFGIPVRLVHLVSGLHITGKYSREALADMVEAHLALGAPLPPLE